MKIKIKDGFCAPIALKTLSGLSDKMVLEACIKSGFNIKENWGMEEYEILEAATLLHIRYRRINLKKRGLYRATLATFIKKYPLGTYMVETNDHVFCIINGAIVDPIEGNNFGLERLIVCAFKIFK